MRFYVTGEQFTDTDQLIEGNKSFRLPQAERVKDISRSSPLPPEIMSDIENSAQLLRQFDVSPEDMMPAMKDKHSSLFAVRQRRHS